MSKDTHNIPKYLRKIRRLKRQNQILIEDISIYTFEHLKWHGCVNQYYKYIKIYYL